MAQAYRKPVRKVPFDDWSRGTAVVEKEAVMRGNGEYAEKQLADLLAAFLKKLQEVEESASPAVRMVTGEGDEELAVDVLKTGALDYLAKSRITAQSLRQSIRNALSIIDQREKLKEEKQALEQLARFDALTNLRNRRSFMADFHQEIDRANRYQRPLSFMILDLDHFKGVNDTYGHVTGDKVLSIFAMLLENTLRVIDVPGRLGGEEFCVLLPETYISGAAIIAERILERAAEETYVGPEGERFHVTCSIGIAGVETFAPRHDDTYYEELRSQLYQQADRALYQAKADGRNCVRSEGPGVQER